MLSVNGAAGTPSHLVACGERHLDDPELVVGFGFQFQDDAATAEDLGLQNDVVLAVTVDVDDMFPRVQRLDGHQLGGCELVWFHPRNRRRTDTAQGLVSADRGQAPTATA